MLASRQAYFGTVGLYSSAELDRICKGEPAHKLSHRNPSALLESQLCSPPDEANILIFCEQKVYWVLSLRQA